MNSTSLAHYLEQGEGVSLEFKRCGNKLGSGTRTLFEHSHYYSGRDPVLEEGNYFVAFVPSPAAVMRHDGGEGAGDVRDSAGYVRDSSGTVRDSSQKFGKSSGKVREKFALELTEPARAVASLMEDQGSITTGEVMKLLGMTDRGAQLLMRRLIEKDVVEKVGAGRSTRYRLMAYKEDA